MKTEKTQLPVYEWILRIGVFGTFLGHGTLALGVKPAWIPLITAFGFSAETAAALLPWIGAFDIVVAFTVLLYPFRALLIWATAWAFVAALSRYIAGEPIPEFIEHTANWAAPLALLCLQGFPKSVSDLWTVRLRKQAAAAVKKPSREEEIAFY